MKPILEKKTAQFIEQLTSQGGPPIYKLPVKEARKVFAQQKTLKQRGVA